jgi:hypothetical protein
MELWIRSQNKYILHKPNNMAIERYDDGKYSIVDIKDSNWHIVLGTYKSEKKCLEILDEIQRLMIASLTDKNLDGYGVVIYEMPEE